MHIFKTALYCTPAIAVLAACSPANEDATVADTETIDMADQGAMTPTTGNIVGTAQGNPDFSTLVSAVTAADLGATLSGAGPFTVFAPSNAAFTEAGDDAVAEWMMPENQETLSSVLTYHVVSGDVSGADLARMITDGGGEAELTTVNGGTLTAMQEGNVIMLTDAAGNTANVMRADIDASNGTIHQIDAVLMPEM